MVQCPWCGEWLELGELSLTASYECFQCNGTFGLVVFESQVYLVKQSPPPALIADLGTMTTSTTTTTTTSTPELPGPSNVNRGASVQKRRRSKSDAGPTESAPEGVAAFIETPPSLACFMYELLRGPQPDKDFFVMPCVGAGRIPLVWLTAGYAFAGGVFCELFPSSLEVLVNALCGEGGLGWSLDEECDRDVWKERLRISPQVEEHLAARNEDTKERTKRQKSGYWKKKKLQSGELSAQAREQLAAELVENTRRREELTHQIHDSKGDADNKESEGLLASPIYRGRLCKGMSCIFLFQGSATSLFGGGRCAATSKLQSIFTTHVAVRGLRVVAAENLPWGDTKFLDETANASNVKIVPVVLRYTTHGTCSAFIINRAGLVADTPKQVPMRIAAVWEHGTIVRMFPLPTLTFSNHDMPMACLFVVRKFTQREQQLYDAIIALMQLKRREEIAPLRYYCGLLAGEDMAWARLQKRRNQSAKQPSKFTDSAMDYQNRVLSDDDHAIYGSINAQTPHPTRQNPNVGYLLQTRGGLAEQLDNRVDEESATAEGEKALELLYCSYRSAVLHVTEQTKVVGAELLSQADVKRVAAWQSRLLESLLAMTNRDKDGNIAYDTTVRRKPHVHDLNLMEAHKEIARLIRLVAVVHRIVVPSFVLEQLTFLHDTYAVKGNAPGLGIELQTMYRALDKKVLERVCDTPDAGQFRLPLTKGTILARYSAGRRPDRLQTEIRQRMKKLLDSFATRKPSPCQVPCLSLMVGTCSQFEIPGGRRACSPISVLALASLLLRGGAIDIMHVLLEGTALYARMMDSAEEQAELVKAIELSMQPKEPPPLVPPSLGPPPVVPPSIELPPEGSSDGDKAVDEVLFDPAEDLGHWAPHSVADVISILESLQTGSLANTSAAENVAQYLHNAPYDGGVALVMGGYTVAVARVKDKLYLFDSHGYHLVSPHAFCAVFSLDQLGTLLDLLGAMINDRTGGENVGFTTFCRFA
jgi:hypothetical protein